MKTRRARWIAFTVVGIVALASIAITVAFLQVQGSYSIFFIDRAGKQVPEPLVNVGRAFVDGMRTVYREVGEPTDGIDRMFDEQGAMRLTGLMHLPQMELFHDGMVAVNARGTVLYLDRQGKVVFRMPGASRGEEFSEGLAVVVTRQAPTAGDYYEHPVCGFVDKTGTYAIPPTFELAGPFSEGIAAARSQGKWGFIDKTGTFVIPPRFNEAHGFSDGLACVRVDRKWGYIDRTGRIVIEPQFQEAGTFSEGLAFAMPWLKDPMEAFDPGTVYTGGPFGFIDKTGVFVIPAQFSRAGGFSGGLAAVQGTAPGQRRPKWGYIDRSGTYVIAPRYDDAGPFVRGVACVSSAPFWARSVNFLEDLVSRF